MGSAVADTLMHEDDQLGGDNNSEADLDSPNVSKYEDTVTNSCAYRWLLARLHREVDLTSFGHDGPYSISTQLRYELDSQLRRPFPSGQSELPIRRMVFRSEWDPTIFIREQEYFEGPGETIERVLTVTEGEDHVAEAMACSEYLCRTWPLHGEEVMELVKEVVRNDLGLRHSGMPSRYLV
jgi:hypothetical protein